MNSAATDDDQDEIPPLVLGDYGSDGMSNNRTTHRGMSIKLAPIHSGTLLAASMRSCNELTDALIANGIANKRFQDSMISGHDIDSSVTPVATVAPAPQMVANRYPRFIPGIGYVEDGYSYDYDLVQEWKRRLSFLDQPAPDHPKPHPPSLHDIIFSSVTAPVDDFRDQLQDRVAFRGFTNEFAFSDSSEYSGVALPEHRETSPVARVSSLEAESSETASRSCTKSLSPFIGSWVHDGIKHSHSEYSHDDKNDYKPSSCTPPSFKKVKQIGDDLEDF